MTPQPSAIYPVIILGAGPAGLSVAYELMRRGITPLVLEKGASPGASFASFPRNIFFGPWMNNLLPGSSINRSRLLRLTSQPRYSKYLQDYAEQNGLPVNCGIQVNSVSHDERVFRLQTTSGELRCHLLVNCTGYFARPYTPDFPGLASTRVPHMHVSQYRDANTVIRRLRQNSGRLLIVGKRLSAGETLVELHKAGFQVSLSYRGELRFALPSWGTAILSPFDWIIERLSIALRIRRNSYPQMTGGESRRLVKSGKVSTYANVARFNEQTVTFEDGREERFDLVIFATGYRAALAHLEPLLGPESHEPNLSNMESTEVPGLFFLGVDQLRTYRSRFLRGIVEDSRALAERVAHRAERLPAPRRERLAEVLTAESAATLL
jgi:lysine/ornithine N-monooxygenase